MAHTKSTTSVHDEERTTQTRDYSSIRLMCSSVIHIKPFSLTRRHPAHRLPVPIFPPREIQALRSQKHDTEVLHCNAVSRVDNAITCHRTGYGRYDRQLYSNCSHSRCVDKRKTKETETNKIAVLVRHARKKIEITDAVSRKKK